MKFKKCLLYGSIILLTMVANLSIKIVAFKKLIHILTNVDNAKESSITAKQKRKLMIIIRLLNRTAQKVPWRVKCFEQAIVVLIFAWLYKININVCFGISKTNDNKILAHAWTKVGNSYVTGGDSAHFFTEIYRRGYQRKKNDTTIDV